MNRLTEAEQILKELEVPKKQTAKICQLALLALADIDNKKSWQEATNEWIRIHDIIQFARDRFGEDYAENSRETFRKQALHHFRNAAFVEDNGKATNSPNYRYRLTNEMVDLLRAFNTPEWKIELTKFKNKHETLVEQYSSKKQRKKIAFSINGLDLTFSPGKHNELQKAVLEEFLPRFAPGAVCLYVGDTAKKDLIREDALMESIGLGLGYHEKLPDVILYLPEKNWVYFIECVTSVGPMSSKRIMEINEMTKNSYIGKIYVTAFPDFKTYKRFVNDIAWDSEIWLADNPDHMIHMNGDRFIGPRQ